MNQSKMKLILHPVRMKIIQSLLNGKNLTVQQLSQRAKDVPQATLYRHLNKLLEADFIQVVQENQIRGTVEKVYALKNHQYIHKKTFCVYQKRNILNSF